MSATTRVNGDGFFLESTLYSVYQLKAIKVTILDNSSTAVDCSSLDDGVDEMVSLVVKEIQPLMYILKGTDHNEIHAIVDGHAIDADTLQLRVREVVAGKLGVAASGNDSTVVVGTSLTVA